MHMDQEYHAHIALKSAYRKVYIYTTLTAAACRRRHFPVSGCNSGLYVRDPALSHTGYTAITNIL